ncbi:MAG TPA: hypothetical protein VHD38_01660 [Candidatus Paceibacterota bacterium]|nr:hypothetical protein [Candidatus Paceibacterota bacterium]
MNRYAIAGIVLAIIIVAALFWMLPQMPSGTEVHDDTATSTSPTQTFTSAALGLSFRYDSSQVGVQERGTIIDVYAVGTDPLQGQHITKFTKTARESLTESIQRQILAGYSTTTCMIEIATTTKGYARAEITYPVPAENPLGHEELCNAAYDKTNGIRYFLYDESHPDRFYFLDIGQYPLLAAPSTPWQETIIIQ